MALGLGRRFCGSLQNQRDSQPWKLRSGHSKSRDSSLEPPPPYLFARTMAAATQPDRMVLIRNISLCSGGAVPRCISKLNLSSSRISESLTLPVPRALNTSRDYRYLGFRHVHSSTNCSRSTMELIYHPEVDIEELEDYVSDGYHPTIIGDTFSSGRYKVVHKLGFGGYSTIWLARDQHKQRYVALKILTAWASRHSPEADILQHSTEGSPTHAGKRFTPPLFDQFSFEGPNGHHRCLVGEPAGCNIARSKEDSPDFMFPPDAARSAAAQLLLGVSYLHDRDICHGGMCGNETRYEIMR